MLLTAQCLHDQCQPNKPMWRAEGFSKVESSGTKTPSSGRI